MKKEENIKNYNDSKFKDNLLLEIALILSKNVKILLFSPFIITLLSILYLLFFSSPIYISSSKILSSNNSSSSKSELIDVASQFGIQLPNNNSKKEYIYPELIKSRTIAKSLLKRKFSNDSSSAITSSVNFSYSARSFIKLRMVLTSCFSARRINISDDELFDCSVVDIFLEMPL